jgi:hypothetical protein
MPLVDTPLPKSAWCAQNAAAPPRGTIEWSGWDGDLASSGYRDTRRSGLSAQTVKDLELRWVFAFPEGTQALPACARW